MNLARSAKSPQLRDATGRHPFGDDDVPVRIETGVVRVEEPTGSPARRIAPQRHAVLENLLAPSRIFAKLNDDFVVTVQQRDPRAKIGNQHDLVMDIDVRRQDKAAQSLLVLALQREPLQSGIHSIRNDQQRWTGKMSSAGDML